MLRSYKALLTSILHRENTWLFWAANIMNHHYSNLMVSIFKVIKQIAVGGDQKTESRCDSAQRCFLDGRNDFEKLQGVWSKFEHWHLKRTLYIVSINTTFM